MSAHVFGISLALKLVWALRELMQKQVPLTSLLLGGIAFDEGPLPTVIAKEEKYFYLYPNYNAVLDGGFTLKYDYVLHFKESVRGLKIGSTVEYKGIKVGRVTQNRITWT